MLDRVLRKRLAEIISTMATILKTVLRVRANVDMHS